MGRTATERQEVTSSEGSNRDITTQAFQEGSRSSDLGTTVSSPTLGLRSGREAWYSRQMGGVEVSTDLERPEVLPKGVYIL